MNAALLFWGAFIELLEVHVGENLGGKRLGHSRKLPSKVSGKGKKAES